MYSRFLELNNRINNSTTFWWVLGVINATSFAMHISTGGWWPAAGALALMGWSMYELNRIQKENNNGES